MAFRKLFFKRVNSSRSSYALQEGDVALDESDFQLYRGDGSTAGGVLISNDPAITTVLSDTTPQLGGDLDINGKDIVSTSNADIDIIPDGTGNINLGTDTVQVGDNDANAIITTQGTGDLTLSTNNGTNSGTIEIKDGSNGDITIEPDGTGDILLKASGQVGIGSVSSPDTSLHIKQSTATLTLQRTNDNNTPGVDFQSNGGNVRAKMYMDGTNGTNKEIVFENQDGSMAEKFRVTLGGAKVTGNLLVQADTPIITIKRDDNANVPGLVWQGSSGVDAASIKLDGTSGTTNELILSSFHSSAVTERLRVQTTGAKVTGILKIGDGDTTDNYAGFGDADDLKIFHNGSHSIIRETGTGSLYIQSNNNVILGKDTGSEFFVRGLADAAVELYHDNTKKFETTSGGVSVTGNLIADGSQIDFTNLPTSDPGVAGRLWNDSNTVKISAG